jgi:hypothetical protein
MVEAIRAELPAEFRERLALVRENLAHLAPAALHARLEPALNRWRRDHEAVRVEALLGQASRQTVVGLD